MLIKGAPDIFQNECLDLSRNLEALAVLNKENT